MYRPLRAFHYFYIDFEIRCFFTSYTHSHLIDDWWTPIPPFSTTSFLVNANNSFHRAVTPAPLLALTITTSGCSPFSRGSFSDGVAARPSAVISSQTIAWLCRLDGKDQLASNLYCTWCLYLLTLARSSWVKRSPLVKTTWHNNKTMTRRRH